jgi:ABC-type nitrate/sulfonate/bicarbonate transport system substrate-binding protein
MHKVTNRRTFLSDIAITGIGIAAGTPFLGGCSRKGDSNGAETDGSSTFSCQLAWVKDAEFMGYYVAKDKGLYRNSKPRLDVNLLGGGPDIIPEATILAKRADVALTTPDTTVNLIIKDNAPLKIIGTQYQKSPLGVVSLEKSKITDLHALVGKTVAVSPVTVLSFEALLNLKGIKKEKVKIVPYAYNPAPLLNGTWDATVDFVTNVPYTITQKGGVPHSFLLWDEGFTVFNDTVVVTEETLRKKRKELIAWLRASRKGWEENFLDPQKYPPTFKDTYFAGNGRENENEIAFNKAQKPLIQPTSGSGIFSMSEADIQANINSLQMIGLAATRSMFDTTLADEASKG